MSYQILAQKYRPQSFDEVQGQEAVTQTLRNSVLLGRIANAYVFCGPRGVGKTSVARLLSKALNCERPRQGNPCNECTSCKEITKSGNIDVLEIDGASNNGVDEIRTLRENVKFSPSKGKFKIYIIDEVHMLSQGAFNALLKTLEEPPSHVKFIFATTEPHRVLATIMSRCQRYDFKKIPARIILERVLDIAQKEKIDIDKDAAILIARLADGSLRDALVILDQMISFSKGKISSCDVIQLLGMVERDKINLLARAIIGKSSKEIIERLDELITSGKDPILIANSLLGHFRDLMILKEAGGSSLDMVLTEEELNEIKAETERLSIEEILYILQNISHSITLMKGTNIARAPLEIALIRLTKREGTLSLPHVIEQLKNVADTQNTISGNISKEEEKETKYNPQPPKYQKIENSAENDLDNSEFLNKELVQEKYNWNAVLNYVKNKKMSVYTFLNAAKLMEFSNTKVVVGFSKAFSFNKEALEVGNNKAVIEEAVNKVTGASPKIEFTLIEFLGDSKEEKVSDTGRGKEAKEAMKPVIEDAMDVFGGHIVRDFIEE